MAGCRVLETWESKVPMWILKLGCRSCGLAATLEVAGCYWCLPRHIFWWCLFDRPLCALSSPPMTLGAIALMTACQNCSFKSWCEKKQFSTCQGLSDFFLLTWQGRNNFGSFLHRDFQCHVSEIVWLCSGRYIHCGTMFKAIFSGATNPNCPASMRYYTRTMCAGSSRCHVGCGQKPHPVQWDSAQLSKVQASSMFHVFIDSSMFSVCGSVWSWEYFGIFGNFEALVPRVHLCWKESGVTLCDRKCLDTSDSITLTI